MKVRDLCISDVTAVTRETSLSRAGSLMRKLEVGSLPVLDRADRVVGIVTDRDCFLGLANVDALASEVSVGELMTERPTVCGEEEDVLDCLSTMRRERVRRLPVVDQDDRLAGIISIDDIVCHAARGQNGREIPYREVIETLSEITREYRGDASIRSAQRIPAREARLRPESSREREGSTEARAHGRRERSVTSR